MPFEAPPPERDPRSRRLPSALVALAASVAVALAVTILVLQQTFATLPVPSGQPSRTLGAPIAAHTVVILLDGLRHDVANDRARMPHLADRFARYGEAELMASPVSMTSAAVLLMGTGVRGDLEQMISNETHKPTTFDSVFGSLHAQGARTAVFGDPIWPSLYPGVWSHDRTHGSHSLEVDEDDALLADALATLRAETPPTLTIVHVNTPDKKGHAHGITAPAYTAYVRSFDVKLESFLQALPPSLSVLLTSDHGATDSGSHGSDTLVQRRSPLLAFGPGFSERPRSPHVDQLDIAATLAALTGVRPPSQCRGHVATEILAVDETRAKSIACAQLANVLRIAELTVGPGVGADLLNESACDALPPARALEASRAAARTLDARIGNRRADSPRGFVPPAIAGALGLALLALFFGGRALLSSALPMLAAAAGVGAAIAMTWGLELLPSLWPDRARIACYAVGNLPLVVLLLRPRALAKRLGARFAFLALLTPGLLLLTEPKTTQAEAFATVAVCTLVILGGRHRPHPYARPEALRRHAPAFVAMALLAVPGVLDDSYAPRWLADRPWAAHATAAAFLGLYLLWRRDHASLSRRDACVIALAGLAGLAIRELGPPALAVFAWSSGGAALCAGALVYTRSKRKLGITVPSLVALVFGLVSRDFEWPYLVAALVLGAHLADELAYDARKGNAVHARAFLLTCAFATLYVGRVGVQQGFHFMHMDWGAGAFRDPAVSTWRIGLGIGTKHALAIAAMLGTMAFTLPSGLRRTFLHDLALACVARVVVITLMLHVCRNSFWTPVWVVGELPNMLITLLCALVFATLHEAREPFVRS